MGLKKIKLPEIGEGVLEGELVSWLVKKGDQVKQDQPLAEVMTDKASVEIPSPCDGVVKSFEANVGDMVAVEGVLLTLEETKVGTGEKNVSSVSKSNQSVDLEEEKPQTLKPVTRDLPKESFLQQVSPPAAKINVLATPATRRLAREQGVDINNIKGTGLLGRVTRDDVLNLNSSSSAPFPPVSNYKKKLITPPPPCVSFEKEEREKKVPLRGVRRTIANKLQKCKQTVPHFSVFDECCVSSLMKVRDLARSQGESHGVKVTYLPFVMKVLVDCVKEFPQLNSSINDDEETIIYKNYYHVGFAADTPQGLLVPHVKNVDEKNIFELSGQVSDLAHKARQGKNAVDELKGATITVTNLGSVGGLYATPIINHPEVAILGMYKITERPVLKNNQLYVSHFMNFSLTCDHRLIDGAVAVRFLTYFIQKLEDGNYLENFLRS